MSDTGTVDPAPGELADPFDERDWDINRDGRMAHFADQLEPETIPWEPADGSTTRTA